MALVHKYGVVGELSFWTAHNNLVEFGLSGSRRAGSKAQNKSVAGGARAVFV